VSWKRVPARNRDTLQQLVFLAETKEVAPGQVTARASNQGNVAAVQWPGLADLTPKVFLPRWVSPEYPDSHPVEMVAEDLWILHGVERLPLSQAVTLRYFRRVE
jgi:hypothetical protein